MIELAARKLREIFSVAVIPASFLIEATPGLGQRALERIGPCSDDTSLQILICCSVWPAPRRWGSHGRSAVVAHGCGVRREFADHRLDRVRRRQPAIFAE